MNPFNKTNSLSELAICCTNIRSLGLSTKNLTHKKLTRILDLKNTINILVDSKITDAEADQVCNNDFKYLLQDYKHVGALTKIKGILVLYNKKTYENNGLKSHKRRSTVRI